MSTFKYTDQELKILKNFQLINQSMIINPDKFSVCSNNKTVVGLYDLVEEYDYEPFGIYDMTLFNAYLGEATDLGLEVEEDNRVIITDKATDMHQTYNTTPIDSGMLPAAQDPTDKFEAIGTVSEFLAPASKLGALIKNCSLSKHERVFIEQTDAGIVLTGATQDLRNSANISEVVIKENNIEESNLEDIISMKVDERLSVLLPGFDYKVEIVKSQKSGKYMSRWSNDVIPGLRYFIALETYEQ